MLTQTIAFAAELQARGRGRLPVLIISPLSVVQHWMQSVRNFAPALAPFTVNYTGEATKRAAIRAQISSKTLILVTTYQLILSDIHLIHGTAFRPQYVSGHEGERNVYNGYRHTQTL